MINYYDKLSYKDPLTKDRSDSFNHKNIQDLATKMFKVKNVSKIVNNLRYRSGFKKPFVNSVYHVSESITYLGPIFRDIVRPEFKQTNPLNGFKMSIRKWILVDCPCKLCRTYISGVDFI